MKKKVLAIAGVSAGVALVTTLGIISIVKKVRKAKREKDLFGSEFGGSVFDTPNDSFSSPCSEKICRNNFDCPRCSCYNENLDSFDDGFLDEDDIFDDYPDDEEVEVEEESEEDDYDDYFCEDEDDEDTLSEV